MSWIYQQSTGILSAPSSSDWKGATWTGYSGHGDGLNNPEAQSEIGVGPIPQGLYTIGTAYDDPEKGPCVMRLTPDPTNEMFDRSGFLMHGDNSKLNFTASNGCVIQSKNARNIVNSSSDKTLQVIA